MTDLAESTSAPCGNSAPTTERARNAGARDGAGVVLYTLTLDESAPDRPTLKLQIDRDGISEPVVLITVCKMMGQQERFISLYPEEARELRRMLALLSFQIEEAEQRNAEEGCFR